MMQQNISVEVINQMQDKIEEQSMFKQIINTMEESIVICQENHIEIANDTFLNQFGHMIYSHGQTTIKSSFLTDYPKILHKKHVQIFRTFGDTLKSTKTYLKKIFLNQSDIEIQSQCSQEENSEDIEHDSHNFIFKKFFMEYNKEEKDDDEEEHEEDA